jgi:hypothetical protein
MPRTQARVGNSGVRALKAAHRVIPLFSKTSSIQLGLNKLRLASICQRGRPPLFFFAAHAHTQKKTRTHSLAAAINENDQSVDHRRLVDPLTQALRLSTATHRG